MKFKQFYLGCLSHASYYIGSGTEAAVIDPQRDVDQYIAEAEANGQQIKYVIETHSHADFVSGHIELARRTGAKIIFGERANTAFEALKVKDGDELALGDVKLKFLETPGHTPEGITILAEDAADPSAPLKMFTGDTLFIGDVGRPDLIGSKGFSADEMGGMLYDSIHNKIMPLPDETEVYPAHGAGSLCGKSLSKETWSTLGEQRKFNYALKPMSKEEFVTLVASDQPKVPAYFPKSAESNLAGPAGIDELPRPEKFSAGDIADFDGIVLDVRTAAAYGDRHIENSINIGLGGKFATWAGTFINVGTPLAIAADSQEQVDEAFMRLARVGLETVKGFVLMRDFDGPVRKIAQVEPEFVDQLRLRGESFQLIDVREPGEHSGGHAPEAVNIPVGTLPEQFEKLDPEVPAYVICQSGYRSSIATGLLENAGFKHISNVIGGTAGWIGKGLETEHPQKAAA